MAVTAQLCRANVGELLVLHSTSWRQSRGGVVLTFVAVVDPAAVAALDRAPIGRVELARGGATTAPTHVDAAPVVEHGLRHLAWLVRDDPVVAQSLPRAWHDVLAQYVPEPFRHLYDTAQPRAPGSQSRNCTQVLQDRQHVEAVRLESACRLLETTNSSIELVAKTCGFGTPETMNRTFRRRLNTTPRDHRHHFSGGAGGAM